MNIIKKRIFNLVIGGIYGVATLFFAVTLIQVFCWLSNMHIVIESGLLTIRGNEKTEISFIFIVLSIILGATLKEGKILMKKKS